MNPLDNNLNEIQNSNTTAAKKNQDSSTPTVTKSNEHTIGKKVTIKKGSFLINEKGEVSTVRGLPIIDPLLVQLVKAQQYLNGLSKEELDKITIKGEEFKQFPESPLIYLNADNYIFPSGAIYTGDNIFAPNSPLGIIGKTIIENRNKPKPEVTNTTEVIEEGIEEEMSLFGTSTPEATPAKKERKRPSKGSASSNISNKKSSPTLSSEEVQRKIDENKDFQKDNCNGIAPI